jgi:hypothetical protein
MSGEGEKEMQQRESVCVRKIWRATDPPAQSVSASRNTAAKAKTRWKKKIQLVLVTGPGVLYPPQGNLKPL